MINKEEFDLLLQEISEIENKIIELKVLNKFDIAIKYEQELKEIRNVAKNIVLDTENSSNGFDEVSIDVIYKLIKLNSNVDYFLLKANNIIESAVENRIDAQALEKIKILWENLENYIKTWNETDHNPIEELEYEKTIGKITLEIIIHQLQIEGVINFHKVFKYCKPESLANSIKEVLFDGAKEEFRYQERKRKYIELAKNMTEKDLYDYKIWQQILIIKDVRSRDDHIEIIGNLQEIDNRKYFISEENNKKVLNEDILTEDSETKTELDVVSEESFFNKIKKWISNFIETTNQKNMALNWKTYKGPAFRVTTAEGEDIFYREFLEKSVVEKTKKLIVASNGLAKYNYEKNASWKELEELEFIGEKNCSSFNLSPDKTYKCIGNDCFLDAKKLKKLNLGNLELIGDRAFKNCTSLEKIVFPKNIKNISEDAFSGCTKLKEVEILGELNVYILERPQNILNCFRNTSLEKILFPSLDSAFNFAIADCPNIKEIKVSKIPGKNIPFRICKYRLGRQEGIVTFVGEKSLNLWKKKNSTIRFFELTEEDKKKYGIIK